uniref:Putative conserved plasma membrane protein n=1 Tax=Amblyomma aureolatum TaxID=187763 RepID=A0A1E1X481_9ACAR
MGSLSIVTAAPWAVFLLLWSVQRASCMTISEQTPPSTAVGQHGGVLVRHSPDSASLLLEVVEVGTGPYDVDQQQPPVVVGNNSTMLTLPPGSVKSVNPFLLVALVVTALLVLLLGFAYVTRKTDPGDTEDDSRQSRDASAASRNNGAFEQDPEGGTNGSGYPSQPPSYDDVIKVPWTIWAVTQQGSFTQGTGATPPPSYEDARRIFPFPE